MQNAKPADDLELYETLMAAYPEKFNEDNEDGDWDKVIDFAESELGGVENVSDLIGRLVKMAMPIQSAISGKPSHCLGKIEGKEGQCYMTATIQRPMQ